jgi:membrane fusion protein (multidrug efflux system)
MSQTTTERKPSEPAEEIAKTAPTMPRRKRRSLLIVGSVLGLAALGIALGLWLYWRHYEDTDDAFVDGHVIPISPKVSGYIEQVHFDDNWTVAKGALLLEIDPRDYEARAAQARGQVASDEGKLAQANAQVERSRAEVDEAEAEVTAAETEAERTEIDWTRYREAPSVVTQQQSTNAHAARNSAVAQLAAARQKLVAARTQVPFAAAQVLSAIADVERSKASLREAELQLSYTKIWAPEDGKVTRKGVEVGQYVQPGEQLLAIVQPDVWVTANFRETQLRYMEPGQPVEVEVDAYPDRKLPGHVDSIQKGSGARFSLIPPENATGNYVKVVQRIPVKIVFDEEPRRLDRLGVGMSVVPKVRVR